MTLVPGTRLGPYRIEGRLGAGGMGEVYRATDTRLERVVAIKTLPAEVATDRGRRDRFEREAKAIAALSHPHICSLYDVGSEDGVEFLVMELLEGQTLASRLAAGPLPLAEALGIACQIAEALAAAHRRGIVHRDLKPANVMVTPSGVKLLDFGLARLRPVLNSEDLGVMETLPATREGQVLGTPQYMAPEQVQGRVADGRADVFALGALVYEMVSGRRAFTGDNLVALSGAILHAQVPSLAETRPEAPLALDRLVSVCLAKDPDERFSTAHDVLVPLRWIADQIGERTVREESRARPRTRAAWAVAGLATGVALILGVLLFGAHDGPAREPHLDRLSIVPDVGALVAANEAPQISPDGRSIAFVGVDASGQRRLFVRGLDSVQVRALPETEDATQPFWAPDSRQVGFFSSGKLRTTSLDGGSAHVLADAPVPRGGSWSSSGEILFVGFPSDAPMRVAGGGGAPSEVPIQGEPEVGGRWFPHFLPDGRHYLYLEMGYPVRLPRGIFVGSVDSEESKKLVDSSASGRYAPPGFLLYMRGRDLVAQPFDPDTLELGGRPVRVAESVGFSPLSYESFFSGAADGLAYQEVQDASRLFWFDRTGRRLEPVTDPGIFGALCLTADERVVVYDRADPDSVSIDIWSLPLEGGTPTRLTFDPAIDFYPVCSPVGEELFFSSLRHGVPNPFRSSLSRPGSETRLANLPTAVVATDLSADGRLVCSAFTPGRQFDVLVMPLDGGESIVVAAGPADERLGRFSPDARWIAYASNETGRYEVFVQPFPPSGAKWQVSSSGGSQPTWRRDGRAIYYTTPDHGLAVVDVVAAGATFSTGPPYRVLEARGSGFETAIHGSTYAVAGNGERILVSTTTEATVPIHVVLEWTALAGSTGGER